MTHATTQIWLLKWHLTEVEAPSHHGPYLVSLDGTDWAMAYLSGDRWHYMGKWLEKSPKWWATVPLPR